MIWQRTLCKYGHLGRLERCKEGPGAYSEARCSMDTNIVDLEGGLGFLLEESFEGGTTAYQELLKSKE